METKKNILATCFLLEEHLRTETFACASSHPLHDGIVSEDRIRVSPLSRLSDSDSPTPRPAYIGASCASPLLIAVGSSSHCWLRSAEAFRRCRLRGQSDITDAL